MRVERGRTGRRIPEGGRSFPAEPVTDHGPVPALTPHPSAGTTFPFQSHQHGE